MKLIYFALFAFSASLTKEAAELKLVGSHPTSTLTRFPAIHTIKAFEDKLYLGYGDLNDFPSVTITSYHPEQNVFTIEFSCGTDSLELFREIGGTLYGLSIDPGFNKENRDYSYLTAEGWRDASPVGMYHVFDMASLDGSDLWMVGSKAVNETPTFGPAVFRSVDGGRNWQDLSIPTTLVRYYWGFPLRGKFYVRDTYYEGTNGTRTAPAPYISIRNATSFGEGASQFVIGAATTTPLESEPRGTARPLVTFDTHTWRTIRINVLDFALSGSNLFTLENRSVWRGSSLTATGALWSRVDLPNVPANARSIEVAGGIVYIGDSNGSLWRASLDQLPLETNRATVVNSLIEAFGGALAFDGNLLGVGAPDHSDEMPLSGQVSIWEHQPSGWRRIALIDPPSESFSGWFGKDLAFGDGVLAVFEAGRDSSRTLRGSSALLHLYESTAAGWQRREGLSIPFAQSVAISGDWLALGIGSEPDIPATGLRLYRLVRGEGGAQLVLQTNIVAGTTRGAFWKPSAQVALGEDLCVVASTGDPSFEGAPGDVKIYQRGISDDWHLQQVLHSPSPPRSGLSFTGGWKHDSIVGAWRADGMDREIGAPMTSRLTSPPHYLGAIMFPDVVPGYRSFTYKVTFRHRWNFEVGPDGSLLDGGQVRMGFNGARFTPIPRTAFSQNGYHGAIPIASDSELRGQSAFTRQSPGFANAAYVTSTFDLGPLEGGNLLIQFVYGGNNSSRATAPNWEIASVVLSLETIDSNGSSSTSIVRSFDLASRDGGFTVETDAPLAPDSFGSSLSLREGWLAVGAPRDDQSALQAGAVHLYQRTTLPSGVASFVLRQTIPSPIGQAEAAFGTSVTLNNSTLLIGAPGVEVTGHRHHGAAFIYKRHGDTWRHVGQLTPPAAFEGEFGTRVAAGGEWFAASSRFSQRSDVLSERVSIHRLSSLTGEIKANGRTPNGSIDLTIRGEPGHIYSLQTTTNLSSPHWTELAPIILFTQQTNFIDHSTPEPVQKYYRLKFQRN